MATRRWRSLTARLQASTALLVVLLASAAVLPYYAPGAVALERASLEEAVRVAGVSLDEDSGRFYAAWLRGRAAARDQEAARQAAQEVALGPGVTVSEPADWAGGLDFSGDIPAFALRAYREAAVWAAGFAPGCHLHWSVLAAIGRVESNHGLYWGAAARISPEGDLSPPILGPPLNGYGDVARITDTDGGRWDQDTVWDRAVGPMQFIPSTWRALGRDGSGDGVADPHNFLDAAVSAAAYLCLASGGDLSDPDQLRQAIYAYNHSWDYVATVMAWAAVYRERGNLGTVTPGPVPAGTGGVGSPPPPPTPTSTVTPPSAGTSTTRAVRPPATTRPRPTTTTTRVRPTFPTASTTTTLPVTRPSITRPTSTSTPPTTACPSTTASATSTTATTTTTTTLPPGETTTSTQPPACQDLEGTPPGEGAGGTSPGGGAGTTVTTAALVLAAALGLGRRRGAARLTPPSVRG